MRQRAKSDGVGCKDACDSIPFMRNAQRIPGMLGSFFTELTETVAETLWPTRCAICDAPGALLCKRCLSSLPYIDVLKACPHCGAPFGALLCTECNDTTLASHGRDELPYDALAHALIINDDTKRIITTYKDHDEMRLVEFIAGAMHRYLDPAWLVHDPVLTFIPSSKKAALRRGFDHCELIARTLAEQADIPLAFLFERPTQEDQRALSRKGRIGNQMHAFMLKEHECVPKSIIVIDDICTTGSTLYSAADTLRANGADHLWGLTFGHVIG